MISRSTTKGRNIAGTRADECLNLLVLGDFVGSSDLAITSLPMYLNIITLLFFELPIGKRPFSDRLLAGAHLGWLFSEQNARTMLG